MAFAKLSGSLLESDARPPRTPEGSAVPAPPRAEERVAPTADACDILERLSHLADAAPLYHSLWEFIRTGDEEGVARVVSELVRAGRSVAEISEVVESLSKLVGSAGREASLKPIEEQPSPGTVHAFGEAAPAPDPDEICEVGTICANNNPVAASWARDPDGVPEPATGMPPQAEYKTATWREPLQNAAEPTIAADLGSNYVGERTPELAAAICSLNPARPKFSARNYAGAALAALLAIAGAGAFLISQPGAKQVGAATALPADTGAKLALHAAAPRAGGVTQPADGPVQRPETGKTAPVPAPTSSAPGAPTALAAPPEAKPAETAAVAAPIVAPAPVIVPAAALTRPAAPAVPIGAGGDGPDPKPSAAETGATAKAASVLPDQPAAVSATPSPAGPATAKPDRAASIRAEPHPVVANLEMPKPPPAVFPPSSSTPPIGAPVPAVIEPKDPPAMPVDTAPLLERGDRLFGTGDVATARLFYERAADAGNSQAALRLGETYDPAFLQRAQLRLAGDRGLAMFWYGRARELGADEADILLKGMQSR
jgi:hypothetical protein